MRECLSSPPSGIRMVKERCSVQGVSVGCDWGTTQELWLSMSCIKGLGTMILSTGFPLGFSKYIQGGFQVGGCKMSELVRPCKILLILVSSALRDEPGPTVMLLPLLRADYSSGAGDTCSTYE